MIFSYGYSLMGKSHIETNTPCQDSHFIEELENGWVLAGVADGVGSAKNSKEGSQLAVRSLLEFCKNNFPLEADGQGILALIRTGYSHAYKKVLQEAERKDQPLESFDTTLSLAIYNGSRLYYGHSGDGGIIGLDIYGNYKPITKAQKGEDGISVLPLRSGPRIWEISSYEEDLAGVILVTDGILDILCPYLLRLDSDRPGGVYVPLVSFFADPENFKEENKEKILGEIQDFLQAASGYDSNKFYQALEKIYEKKEEDYKDLVEEIRTNNYPFLLMEAVQDDKTLVGLINTGKSLINDKPGYYQEPDWARLQDTWNRMAYPSLYLEEKEEKTSEEDIEEKEENFSEKEDLGKNIEEEISQDQEKNSKENFRDEKENLSEKKESFQEKNSLVIQGKEKKGILARGREKIKAAIKKTRSKEEKL